jgi:hypothetical protein
MDTARRHRSTARTGYARRKMRLFDQLPRTVRFEMNVNLATTDGTDRLGVLRIQSGKVTFLRLVQWSTSVL